MTIGRSWAGGAALALFAPAAFAEPQGDAYRFAVVGHLRSGPGNGNLARTKLERLIERLRAEQLAFVVLTGDIVWGDIYPDPQVGVDGAAIRRDWDSIDQLFAGLGVPVHRAPGNHDIWDPTTRDIWLERYGRPFGAFEFRGSRFVLLNSCWTPTGDKGSTPGKYIRGAPLPDEQIAFLREQADLARDAEHLFVFQHHLLWWYDDAPWWKDVHPLLANAHARAVFGGDLGPGKFSHETRDGVEYVQSALDFTDTPPMEMLRNNEGSRTIVTQLDNYVVVSVDGPKFDMQLRVVDAFDNENLAPKSWRDIYEYDADSFERKVFRRMNTPERAWMWVQRIGAGAFAAGLAVAGCAAWILGRRRSC